MFAIFLSIVHFSSFFSEKYPCTGNVFLQLKKVLVECVVLCCVIMNYWAILPPPALPLTLRGRGLMKNRRLSAKSDRHCLTLQLLLSLSVIAHSLLCSLKAFSNSQSHLSLTTLLFCCSWSNIVFVHVLRRPIFGSDTCSLYLFGHLYHLLIWHFLFTFSLFAVVLLLVILQILAIWK